MGKTPSNLCWGWWSGKLFAGAEIIGGPQFPISELNSIEDRPEILTKSQFSQMIGKVAAHCIPLPIEGEAGGAGGFQDSNQDGPMPGLLDGQGTVAEVAPSFKEKPRQDMEGPSKRFRYLAKIQEAVWNRAFPPQSMCV